MNGPEHYVTAEALLDSCQVKSLSEIDDKGRRVPHYPGPEVVGDVAEDSVSNALRAAQVHATLALAAATAATQATAYDGDEYSARSRGWAGVA